METSFIAWPPCDKVHVFMLGHCHLARATLHISSTLSALGRFERSRFKAQALRSEPQGLRPWTRHRTVAADKHLSYLEFAWIVTSAPEPRKLYWTDEISPDLRNLSASAAAAVYTADRETFLILHSPHPDCFPHLKPSTTRSSKLYKDFTMHFTPLCTALVVMTGESRDYLLILPRSSCCRSCIGG